MPLSFSIYKYLLALVPDYLAVIEINSKNSPSTSTMALSVMVRDGCAIPLAPAVHSPDAASTEERCAGAAPTGGEARRGRGRLYAGSRAGRTSPTMNRATFYQLSGGIGAPGRVAQLSAIMRL